MLHLKAKDIIDKETEIHYAYHKSLKDITIEHYHDFFEIFLITKGKAVHRINGKKKVIDKGTLVFIRPDDKHFYEKYGSQNCELVNLAFSKETLYQLIDFYGKGFNSKRLLEENYPPLVNLPKMDEELLAAKFEKLNTIPRENKSSIKMEFRILIADIFSGYFKEQDFYEENSEPEWLLKLRSEMQKKENFTAGINKMYQLTEKSPEHLSRTFKKIFDETPTVFINKLRLNYAANLLSNSDRSIMAISMESGFENLSHFYHKFKEHFNLSPKSFRNQNQKISIPF